MIKSLLVGVHLDLLPVFQPLGYVFLSGALYSQALEGVEHVLDLDGAHAVLARAWKVRSHQVNLHVQFAW